MEEKVLNLIKRQPTYKLIIPVEVEDKIRHLCRCVPNVEWSGTLFFTSKGSMETNDLEITCRDIFVMDIGSAGYTEFDMSPEVIGYMTDNPELLDMQMGLIHSHNNMATFFSGTDTGTLKEEGRDRNHFVSLIVNNAGTYTAAITRKVKASKTVHEIYSYGTFNDETVSSTKEYIDEEEVIEYFMLDIIKENEDNTFKELDARLEFIRKRKSEISSKSQEKPILKSDKDNKHFVPSLFDTRIDESEPPRYINVDMTKETINEILIQLITGSIIIKDSSKIDIKKWIDSMPYIFDRRFNKDIKAYSSWADAHCEFLIMEKIPANISQIAESEYITDVATALHTELSQYKVNKYILELKAILEQWMIE